MPETAVVETDQVPADTEVQTEIVDAPQEEAVEDAAAPVEEEAAAPQLQVEEERRYTEAEVRERAEATARAVLESEQRRRQSENGRRAEMERREAVEREELLDVVNLAVARGDDPEAINRLMQRYTDKREDQFFSRHTSDLDIALEYITAPITGRETPVLTPKAHALATRVFPVLNDAIDKIVAQQVEKAREGMVPEADIPKLVAAGIAARNRKNNEGKEDIKRPEGTTGADRGSRDWWSSIGPEGRKDPANQRLFDDWISKNS